MKCKEMNGMERNGMTRNDMERQVNVRNDMQRQGMAWKGKPRQGNKRTNITTLKKIVIKSKGGKNARLN